MECCVTVPALSAIQTRRERKKYWENFFLTGEIYGAARRFIHKSYSQPYFVTVGFLDRVTQT